MSAHCGVMISRIVCGEIKPESIASRRCDTVLKAVRGKSKGLSVTLPSAFKR